MQISENGHSLVCTGVRRHCFDGGAGGYVSLAPRHPGGGDAKEAVRSRTAFLERGYYQPAADALCDTVRELLPAGSAILDAGCGEGYYSNRLAGEGYVVLGVDLSKFAADTAARTARRHAGGRTVFAVASVFDLPVQEASADGVVSLFAPCAPAEFVRVLKPGGFLVVAGAGAEHLMGLKQILYDDPYVNQPRRDLPDAASPLELVDTRHVTFPLRVCGEADVQALLTMTPYYWRTSREGKERLTGLDRLESEASFDFFIYRRKNPV
jgi:23S rRNA (guanine745-N1)-methyltransferase